MVFSQPRRLFIMFPSKSDFVDNSPQLFPFILSFKQQVLSLKFFLRNLIFLLFGNCRASVSFPER